MADTIDMAINVLLGVRSLAMRMHDLDILGDALKKVENPPQPIVMAQAELQFGAMSMLFKLKDDLYAIHRLGEIDDEKFDSYLNMLRELEDKMHPKQEEKE